MRKAAGFATALVLFGATTASAASYNVMGTVTGDNLGDGALTITFDQFDSGFGVLTAVNILALSLTSTADITITNQGTSTETQNIQLLSAVTYSDDDGLFNLLGGFPVNKLDTTGDITLPGTGSAPANQTSQTLSTAANNGYVFGADFGIDAPSTAGFTGTGDYSMTFTFDTGFVINTGSNFAITGDSINAVVGTIQYVYDETPPPSAVPLPAALPLMGLGMAGLAFVARRRKS